MIKAVCAEKAQKLLFSRLEPDRFIIPRLCVSSADSGIVAGLGRYLHVWGGGGGWNQGLLGRGPPTNCLPADHLSSSVGAQPNRQADAFRPPAPGLVTGRARGQMGLQGHLSGFPSPCYLLSAHFTEGFLKAQGMNGE